MKKYFSFPSEERITEGTQVLVRGQIYQIEQASDYQMLYLKNNSISYHKFQNNHKHQNNQKDQKNQKDQIDQKENYQKENHQKDSHQKDSNQKDSHQKDSKQKDSHQEQSVQEPYVIIYESSGQKLRLGNIVEASGELEFFEEERNPGGFSQKLYYRTRKVAAYLWSDKVQCVNGETDRFKNSLYNFRLRWKSLLMDAAGEEDGGILCAVLLGEKRQIDGEVKELYQVNGMAHILAISGLHLSFIGIGIYKILRRLTGSYPVGAVFAILAVVQVVQEGISVCTLYNNGQQMKTRRLQSSPEQHMKDGPLFVYFMRFWEYVWQIILQGLTASVGINLVIFPILLYYFYEFPLYSFVLNLFVIPLMSVLLFLGMAGSLLALWFAPVSAILFWICSKILWIYKASCEITLGLPGARLVIGRPEIWQIAIYYVFLFSGLIWLRYMILSVKTQEEQAGKGSQADWRNRKKKQIAVFFLWVVGIVILSTRFGEAGKLTTVVLDVGQGDGIFMKGPEGNTYLVDGGSSDVKKVGQYRLEPFLKSQGVGRLDYVLISHGDSDHMNGVEELIERQNIGVKIGTLVLPVKEVWDEALEELAGKARNHGIRVAVIEPGQSIREGEMVITCIQPGNMGIESEDAESSKGNTVPGTGRTGLELGNEASMVLAVRYGEFDMLFTGDVEEEGERQLTKQLEESYLDCTWEVLKVAHHGSKNSSTEGFLQLVRPAYALISAGQENRYGHPHQETVKRLADVGSKVYSTQENGAIIVEVEGGEILRMKKWQR